MKLSACSLYKILFVSLILWNATALNASTIEFGMFDMPPFYNVKDGVPTGGICYDIMINMLEKAKIPFVAKVYPAPRLYANLVSGKTDVFIGIKDVPVYKDKVLYGATPVSQAELGVYSIGSSPIKTKMDLVGKSVIVVRGYGYGGMIEFLKDPLNKVQLSDASTHESALKMLKMKRGEYLLDYTATINDILKKEPYPQITYSVLNSVPLYLIVSKSTLGGEQILTKLMAAYDPLPKTSEIKITLSK